MSIPDPGSPRSMSHRAEPVIHGFRSDTAVIAYCGAIERPDPAKPRMCGTSRSVPDNACPDCAAVYVRLLHAHGLNLAEAEPDREWVRCAGGCGIGVRFPDEASINGDLCLDCARSIHPAHRTH